jgi:hypothetical protein
MRNASTNPFASPTPPAAHHRQAERQQFVEQLTWIARALRVLPRGG